MTRPYRAQDGQVSYGTFIKTGAPTLIEILATTQLHFGVLDAEHSPLDRSMIDLMLLTGRAVDLPLLVRVPAATPVDVQTALDAGAAGLVVPHVDTAEQAREVVARARFRAGCRGFSSSTRSAGYGGLAINEVLDAGDRSLIVCQIETPEAVTNAEAIAAVDGVGGLLVGRADLAVAMGASGSGAAEVMASAAQVTRVARAAGKIAGMAVGAGNECAAFAKTGVNWFIVGSDQSLLRRAAQDLLQAAGAGEVVS